MLPELPKEYEKKIVQMVYSDTGAIHLFCSVNERKFISLSDEFDLDGTENALEDLVKSDRVEKNSVAVLEVFSECIEEGIISGTERSSLSTDIAIRLKNFGEYKMCHVRAQLLKDEQNRITDIHFVILPYSEDLNFRRDILRKFTSDKSPELYGKRIRLMMDSHPDDEIAFIQFDVERFKLVNELYGVDKADDLLRFFNDSLELICRSDQPFCRLTADVFMIVTPFKERSELLDFIHRVESMLTGFNGMEYRLIFGVAIVDDRTLHTRRHGDNASLARQLIKGSAIENIGFYDSSMKTGLKKKQIIEENMQKALLNREFAMYLQPKYSISTGKIIGAEALARWIHPVKGIISPADFIPVFEENGFILKLDKFIWEEACAKLREQLDLGITPVPISVNISRTYINSFDVISELKALTQKYDIPVRLLELEITESQDTAGVEDIVKKMKNEGFTMLMDDFGSGYSSLNMLKSTPFDVLKIDRAFLEEFMDSDRGRKIIEHTISMSRDIGLGIVAEGVETSEQAEFLSRCGCDSAQGFYYSKPIPASEFNSRLVEVNK